MASVLERIGRHGGITYRVQFRIDGHMRQETFKDQRQANRFGRLVDKVGGARARDVLESRRETDVPTLSEWFDRFLDPTSGILTGITDGTRWEYRSVAQRSFLQSALAETPVDMITREDVAAWIDEESKTPTRNSRAAHKRDPKNPLVPLSPKTVGMFQSLLSQVLQSAVNQEIMGSNPAHAVRIPRGRKPEMVFLTPAEFEVLMRFLPDHWQPLARFLALTGCRFGEATAVTFGDINRNATPPTVRIDKAWKHAPGHRVVLGPPKTEAGNRTVGIPPVLLDSLGTGAPADLVFRTERGNQVRRQHFSEVIWHKAVQDANDPKMCAALGLIPIGKRPRVHDLRHSHVSWLIAQGVPLPVIKRRLGHESITTTVDTYGHLMPDVQALAVGAVESALGIES